MLFRSGAHFVAIANRNLALSAIARVHHVAAQDRPIGSDSARGMNEAKAVCPPLDRNALNAPRETGGIAIESRTGHLDEAAEITPHACKAFVDPPHTAAYLPNPRRRQVSSLQASIAVRFVTVPGLVQGGVVEGRQVKGPGLDRKSVV